MGTSDDGVPTAGLPHHPHRDGATNVLLLAPAGSPADADACLHLLADTDAEARNVLALGYSTPPDQAARAARADGPTGDTTFVCIGERTRSAASTTSAFDPVPGAATAQVVPDPADLARIGVVVNECLEEWADVGARTVICYHSLTDLLEYVDLQTAFRFLHVMTGRIAAADAQAHFHLDPAAHDEETVRTLSLLFDDVVRVDEVTE
jgi:hypothetical protein